MKTHQQTSDVQFALMGDGSVIIHQKFSDGRCAHIEVGTVAALTPIIEALSEFQKRCIEAGYGAPEADKP